MQSALLSNLLLQWSWGLLFLEAVDRNLSEERKMSISELSTHAIYFLLQNQKKDEQLYYHVKTKTNVLAEVTSGFLLV